MYYVGLVALLIVGSLGAPTYTDYDAECGEKYGVTLEFLETFRPFRDNWSQNVRCYAVCETERLGGIKDGQFTEEFIKNQTTFNDEAGSFTEKMVAIVRSCLRNAEFENCGAVHSYAACAFGTLVHRALGSGFLEVIFALQDYLEV